MDFGDNNPLIVPIPYPICIIKNINGRIKCVHSKPAFWITSIIAIIAAMKYVNNSNTNNHLIPVIKKIVVVIINANVKTKGTK